jgi:hypothetical protein
MLPPVAWPTKYDEIGPCGEPPLGIRHVVVCFETPQLCTSSKHDSAAGADDSAELRVHEHAYGCIAPAMREQAVARVDVGQTRWELAIHLQTC